MSLKPDKFTYTMILTSPTSFPGELESEHFLLTHAWPDFASASFDFDPNSRYTRNFFALTFREQELSPEEQKKLQLPHYGFVGDYFSVFLSLYFGKRFENLGFHLDNGKYRVPNLEPSNPRKSSSSLPFSSKSRKDLNIPLRLDESAPIIPLLDSIFSEVHRDIKRPQRLSNEVELAFTAGRFYQQALQLYDADPEFAYLSLVNAGEVLVSGLQFDEQELYDSELQTLIAEIELHAGAIIAQKVKKRLFQVRRKFTNGLSRMLNAAFYSGSESTRDFLNFKSENILKHLKAAYDLRSRFLHRGTRFGGWISDDFEGGETALGEPAYGEEDWKKLILAAPVLNGLERIIRFCLLRFIHQRVTPLHPLLE